MTRNGPSAMRLARPRRVKRGVKGDAVVFVVFSQAAYILVDDYTAANFFREFDFFSRRLPATKAYDSGLIIADIEHMPGGICGTWPAFWMFGPNWPNNGEIDIIEGVHEQTSNLMAMHTKPGCRITNSGDFAGDILTPDCDVHAPGQPANAGCSVQSKDTASYGAWFNANGGGVYATEISETAVTIWFFPRNTVPGDIETGTPNPKAWPKPMAKFHGACDIAANIKQQKIVFDTTFCGDWAGSVWSTSSCAAKAATCQEFVQHNPTAFKEAYWNVNYVRYFSNKVPGVY
ncbi:mixed-linked glucanase [Histoplasma capsulatum H143]|uniref:Mixed-linked glucanase n=1 Tax=Ajellomyces capsulatus (strain H143) TaxID=544712 RepID=C6HKT0_AJECH|nr:mixed-linked glucanase [Histoplasma capsulatum H143]